jgi:hypothetical protein
MGGRIVLSDFDVWLAQFADDEGALGDLARFAATGPHGPPSEGQDPFRYLRWLVDHPDTVIGEGGVLHHPHIESHGYAGDRFMREVMTGAPPAATAACSTPAEGAYEALAATMENGPHDVLVAQLKLVELDAEQRAELLAQATAVRGALKSDLPSPDEHHGGRYARATTIGLVCHSDADAAARWLSEAGFAVDGPAGREELAELLADAVEACWAPEQLREFVDAATRDDRGAVLYPLVLVLCRRTGITVEPTSQLATGCVDFYVRDGRTARAPHGLAAAADPREDPLLPRVLPQMDLTECGVYNFLSDSEVGRRFLRMVLDNGLLDRDLLLRKLVDRLRQAADGDDWFTASCYTTMFEELEPTKEEFAACHDSYARIASLVPSGRMSAALTKRAVAALLAEERLPAEVVDRWVNRILEEDMDIRNVHRSAAIGEIAGSGLLTDARIADLVRHVTSPRKTRPLNAMRALLEHAGHGRLTTQQLTACAHEVLPWPEDDVAMTLLTLLRRTLEHEPDAAATVVPALAGAFWHPSEKIQDAALALAEEHRQHIGDDARALVATAARQLSLPALQSRALAVFGPAPDATAAASPTDTHRTPSVDTSPIEPVLHTLPAELRDQWLALLRPGVFLDTEDRDGAGPIVGRIGGLPDLPKDVPWPVWEGHGPLTHYATLDCAALPTADLDLPLPQDGTLVFFRYAEWDYLLTDDADEVYAGFLWQRAEYDEEPGAGATVLHIPTTADTRARPTPEGLTVFEKVPLRMFPTALTAPDHEHVALTDAGIDTNSAALEAFSDALDEFSAQCAERHQGLWPAFGGYASPMQWSVESEISHTLLGADATQEEDLAEQRRWVMLASFDEGPQGMDEVLYWMIRREDLAAGRFEAVVAVAQRRRVSGSWMRPATARARFF